MSKSEPLNSPFSRLYLSPETRSDDIMNCSLKFKCPIDVDALKKALSNSLMLKHPRFCSLLVRNPHGGEYWKRTRVNLDDHFILHHPITDLIQPPNYDADEEEAVVDAYLADIAVSTPLSETKPLWEVHVLVGLKWVVLRVHHAIGDGVSLMSLLSSCFGPNSGTPRSGVSDHPNVNKHINPAKTKWKVGGIWELIKSLWFTLVFGLSFLGRILWVKEKDSLLSGGDGVELWPRKIVTAKFNIKDFKSIKLAIPNVTVNDVLLGVISHGLSKYADAKSPKGQLQGLDQVTAILVVNLRQNSSLKEMSDLMSISSYGLCGWGNKTGIVLLPNYCCNGPHPLDHVKAMKATMDKKKQSYEAHISFWVLKFLTSFIGPKIGGWFYQRILCKTTLLVSNIMGPSEQIVIGDNPVMRIRLNNSSQPHAITMHMVSYAGAGAGAGQAELQVMVAKEIIPDPEFLANCFQDSLLELLNCIKIKT